MRHRKALLTLATVPLLLGGCGATGGGDPAATPAPSGTPWIYYAAGSPTPSPFSNRAAAPASVEPALSFLPLDLNCSHNFTRIDEVLIPLKVVPGKGTLKVTWPRQYDSNYRITAVKQPLISGNQPPYTWQNVAPGSGCTVTATIRGLASGVAYVVWLDAPNTGYQIDGTRHLYSGRSGVVYPR